jgi:hypothetical protein
VGRISTAAELSKKKSALRLTLGDADLPWFEERDLTKIRDTRGETPSVSNIG